MMTTLAAKTITEAQADRLNRFAAGDRIRRRVRPPHCAACRQGDIVNADPDARRGGMVATAVGWRCPTCGAIRPYSTAEVRRARRYEREVPVVQLGAILHSLIHDDVGRSCARLGVDREAAREIVGRVLDMIETDARRLGGLCPECDEVVPMVAVERPDGGFCGRGTVYYSETCPTHGDVTGRTRGLVIVFPNASDVEPPPVC